MSSPDHDLGRPESLGALVLGVSAIDLAMVLPKIAAAERAGDSNVVLITDLDDILASGLLGYVIEYLPPVPALLAAVPEGDADLYIRRRVELLQRKWNLRQVLVFGSIGAGLVQKWRTEGQALSPDPFASGILSDNFGHA